MANYKIVRKGKFAFNPMHVGRDEVLPIGLLEHDDRIIVSPAYTVFEIKDTSSLDKDYLMMWFRRREFDRKAWFTTDSSVRGGFSWDSLCDMDFPLPNLERQKESVHDYKILFELIQNNFQIIINLEKSIQAIYRKWFLESDLKDLSKEFLSQYIDINPKLSIKRDLPVIYVEMDDLSTQSMCINNFSERIFTSGSKFQKNDTLLARITPSLENGKTGFVSFLKEGEVAFGSTEFIVLRAKEAVSPYWVYCLARDDDFRSYAISSMVGSSGRQRVHEKYLNSYEIKRINPNTMSKFHKIAIPYFELIELKSLENQKLHIAKNLLLSKLSTH